MKKLLCLFLALVAVFSLCACGGSGENETGKTGENEEPKIDATATEAETAKLEEAYTGLTMHHGQLHDHANTGPRSDGKATLQEWLACMPDVGMEYAAILDHRQTHHMYLDLWDPTIFISGSEAMTHVRGRPEYCNKYHYNMIFPSVEKFEEHLNQFPKIYRYIGGVFEYLDTTPESFLEIINSTLDKGGYFVIPHPLQTDPEQIEITDPEFNPLDYYHRDFIGYEVLYAYYNNDEKQGKVYDNNYYLYTQLLAADKRVYCSAASDRHGLPTNYGLSTVYSSEKMDDSYIEQLRQGNYTAGPVGVRMILGDTRMGGTGTFEGQRLVISVGDFHKDFQNTSHTYRVDVHTDSGKVYSQTVDPTQTTYIALDADASAKFYRVEIHDEQLNPHYTLLAMGNPIWNSAKYAD